MLRNAFAQIYIMMIPKIKSANFVLQHVTPVWRIRMLALNAEVARIEFFQVNNAFVNHLIMNLVVLFALNVTIFVKNVKTAQHALNVILY